MAKRAGATAGNPAAGVTTTDVEVLDGRDALGNDRDDVALEDGQSTEAARAAAAAPNLDDDSDDSEGKSPLPVMLDPRDALAAGFRERRAAAKSGQPVPVSDDVDETEDGDADIEGDAEPGEVLIIDKHGRPVVQPGDQDQKTTRATETRAQPGQNDQDATGIPEDREVVVVVDGVKVRMTYGEMVRTTQMNLAAESRLRQANDLLDRARTVTNDSAQTRTAPATRDQDEPAPQETRKPVKVDPGRVKALVSKIQLGDDDEAAAALSEAISIGVQEGLAQSGQTNAGSRDVHSIVDHAFVEREARGEVNAALKTVAERFADVIGDEDYYRSAMVRAHDSAVKQLRTIGVPEEDLGLPAMEVLKGYAELRQDPRYREKLKPMSDVFVGAAQATREKFNLPTPQGEDPPRLTTGAGQQQTRVVRTGGDRSGRKALVTVQPRSGSIRTDHTAVGAPPKRTPPSDVVLGMAQQRGQFVGTRQ